MSVLVRGRWQELSGALLQIESKSIMMNLLDEDHGVAGGRTSLALGYFRVLVD